MTERPAAVTFKGSPMTLIGKKLNEGDKAPSFVSVGKDLADLRLDQYKGKVVILSLVPSVDTSVCATETRRFNVEAAKLSKDIAILTISMDLPFAQSRFCAAEGIDQVVLASDYKYRDVGEKYGVLIKELGLLARAVFVIDRAGTLVHAQYVPEIASEPDYEAVIQDASKAL